MAPAIYFGEGLSAPSDHGFTMTATLLKPTSRGRVALRSARPDAKPRIYHYPATAEDRATSMAFMIAFDTEHMFADFFANMRAGRILPPL